MQQNMMGQNIIITEPSSNLRALGRNALAGKWKIAIVAVIVYQLCLQVPPAILNALFGVNLGDLVMRSGGYNSMYYNYSYMYDSMPKYSSLSGIYELLVTGAFTLGITLFFLALFRRQLVGIGDIFLGFERFGKALGLMLFQGLFIFLWMMLFIVPGIIAAIRYSQAFFILADDPNKGIRECMDESKRMMKGNKGKFFCMNLSFIGWALLAAVPTGILSSIADLFSTSGFTYAIVNIISSLFIVPVTVYIFSTQAGFYEILAGHLIKETEPAPIAPEAILREVPYAKAADDVNPEKPAEPVTQKAESIKPEKPVEPVIAEAPPKPAAAKPEEHEPAVPEETAKPAEPADAPVQEKNDEVVKQKESETKIVDVAGVFAEADKSHTSEADPDNK